MSNLEKPTETVNWLDVVAAKVKDLRFGTVQIVVQDSRVVQIERTEKTRLEQQSTNFRPDRTTGGK